MKPSTPYLPIEPDGEDVARITVVADFCPFLEVVDIHLPRLCATHYHHQATREEALHNVNIRDFIYAVERQGWLGFQRKGEKTYPTCTVLNDLSPKFCFFKD